MRPMLMADLHTHTVSSGHAFATLDELVAAARKKGVSMLGVTDHGPSMEGAPHAGFFDMASRAPVDIEGIRVLLGVEANVIDADGTLDLPPPQLETQSLILAGLHGRTPYTGSSTDDNTKALIRSMEQYRIHVLSHPYRRSYPIHVDEVAQAASDTDTLLEINVSLLLLSRSNGDSATIEHTAAMVDAARSAGARCIISSDAHFSQEVGSSPSDLAWIWAVLHLDDDIVENHRIAAAGCMQK